MSDLCFNVPEDKLDANEAITAKSLPTKLAKPALNNNNVKAFMAKHNVGVLLGVLTGVLLRDKPVDAIQHIITHMQNPVNVPVCDDVSPYLNEESVKYLHEHNIHAVFDDLLSSIVDEFGMAEDSNVVCCELFPNLERFRFFNIIRDPTSRRL